MPDPNQVYESGFKKDWETFLSDEMVARDAPIPEVWAVLYSLHRVGNRVIFITGRPRSQWAITNNWLLDDTCPVRALFAQDIMRLRDRGVPRSGPIPKIYMRSIGDRRPSHVVKEELLHKAIRDGYDPKIVFEDRKDDAEMWRRNGLLCCQVAEGDY